MLTPSSSMTEGASLVIDLQANRKKKLDRGGKLNVVPCGSQRIELTLNNEREYKTETLRKPAPWTVRRSHHRRIPPPVRPEQRTGRLQGQQQRAPGSPGHHAARWSALQ